MARYYAPKLKIEKQDVRQVRLCFDNGDFVELKTSEFVDLKLNTYDKLVRCYDGFCPVICSGFLKLKICAKRAFNSFPHLVSDEYSYLKNRKEYIENKCTKGERITEIWLYNSYNWHLVLKCSVSAKIDGEFLILEFLQVQNMGECESENHFVDISNLKKESIFSMDLDFENCDGINVYNSEIKELNLSFNSKLAWGSSVFNRSVAGGYMIVELEQNASRFFCLNDFNSEKRRPSLKRLEKRICGNGEDVHDICHLYIDFYPYVSNLKECVEVYDIRFDEQDYSFHCKDYDSEESDDSEDFDDSEDSDELDLSFYGGFAKKLQNGAVVIAFGKNAQKTAENIYKNFARAKNKIIAKDKKYKCVKHLVLKKISLKKIYD